MGHRTIGYRKFLNQSCYCQYIDNDFCEVMSYRKVSVSDTLDR